MEHTEQRYTVCGVCGQPCPPSRDYHWSCAEKLIRDLSKTIQRQEEENRELRRQRSITHKSQMEEVKEIEERNGFNPRNLRELLRSVTEPKTERRAV